jgi:hypothetical protein
MIIVKEEEEEMIIVKKEKEEEEEEETIIVKEEEESNTLRGQLEHVPQDDHYNELVNAVGYAYSLVEASRRFDLCI